MAHKTPPASPRTAAAPLPPSPTQTSTWGQTAREVIFTPGGSQVIRENLARVLQYKEYRLHGFFVLAVTTIRSAIDIPTGIGVLLLETTTWFVDITRPREEGGKIIGRNLSNIAHCIKTTIALPFFALGGVLFPQSVFGCFEYVPGPESKLALIKAHLEKLHTATNQAAKENGEAQAELKRVQDDIQLKTQEQAAARQKLKQAVETCGSLDSALQQLQSLQDEAHQIETTLADLRSQEAALRATIASKASELEVVGARLQQARNNAAEELKGLIAQRDEHRAALAETEGQLSSTRKDLEAVQKQVADANAQKEDISLLESRQKELNTALTTLESQANGLKEALEAALPKKDPAAPSKVLSHKELIEETQKALQELSEAIKKEAAAKTQHETQNRDLEQKKGRLTEDVAAQEAKMRELGEAFSSKQADLDRLEKQLQAKAEEQKKLEEATTKERGAALPPGAPAAPEAKEKSKEVEDELAELRRLEEEKRTVTKEKEGIEKAIAEKRETLRGVEGQFKTAQERAEEMRKELDEISSRLEDTKKEQEKIAKENSEKRAALEKEYQDRKDALEKEHQSKLAEASKELETVTNQLAEARKEKEKLERENSEAKSALESEKASQGAAPAEELAKSSAALKAREEELTRRAAELAEKEQAVAREKDAQERSATELRTQKEALSQRVAEFEASETAARTQKEKEAQQSEKAARAQAEKTLKLDEDLSRRTSELETREAASQSALETKKRELEQVDDEVKKSRATLEEIEKKVRELEKKKEEKEKSIEENNVALKKIKDEGDAYQKRLTETGARLREENRSLQEKIDKLKREEKQLRGQPDEATEAAHVVSRSPSVSDRIGKWPDPARGSLSRTNSSDKPKDKDEKDTQ